VVGLGVDVGLCVVVGLGAEVGAAVAGAEVGAGLGVEVGAVVAGLGVEVGAVVAGLGVEVGAVVAGLGVEVGAVVAGLGVDVGAEVGAGVGDAAPPTQVYGAGLQPAEENVQHCSTHASRASFFFNQEYLALFCAGQKLLEVPEYSTPNTAFPWLIKAW